MSTIHSQDCFLVQAVGATTDILDQHRSRRRNNLPHPDDLDALAVRRQRGRSAIPSMSPMPTGSRSAPYTLNKTVRRSHSQASSIYSFSSQVPLSCNSSTYASSYRSSHLSGFSKEEKASLTIAKRWLAEKILTVHPWPDSKGKQKLIREAIHFANAKSLNFSMFAIFLMFFFFSSWHAVLEKTDAVEADVSHTHDACKWLKLTPII